MFSQKGLVDELYNYREHWNRAIWRVTIFFLLCDGFHDSEIVLDLPVSQRSSWTVLINGGWWRSATFHFLPPRARQLLSADALMGRWRPVARVLSPKGGRNSLLQRL